MISTPSWLVFNSSREDSGSRSMPLRNSNCWIWMNPPKSQHQEGTACGSLMGMNGMKTYWSTNYCPSSPTTTSNNACASTDTAQSMKPASLSSIEPHKNSEKSFLTWFLITIDQLILTTAMASMNKLSPTIPLWWITHCILRSLRLNLF